MRITSQRCVHVCLCAPPFPLLNTLKSYHKSFHKLNAIEYSQSAILSYAECSDYRRIFWLDIGFIDHLYTQLVITINYSAIADFYTLPNHDKPFPACSVFTSSFLVTTSINGCSSASVLESPATGASHPIFFSCFSCPLYNPFSRTE
jgi:hypothetical protein